VALFAALVIGAAAWFAPGLLRDGRAPSVFEIGGPFVLASSKGGVVDSKTLAGKPYAVFFGFTHCPEVCPTTLYDLSSTLATLGDAAKDFRIFFITVDPERDTVDAMKDYVANFDPRIEALVPTPEQLKTLASDFRVFYAKVPGSDGGYTMDHTATVFLFDARGRLAGTLGYDEAPDNRLAKLKRLLGS
jgi:protein SCO1/2